MENLPKELINFLAIGIPECIALTILAITLLGTDYQWKKIILISAIVSIVVLVLRIFALAVGIHTAIALLTMAVLISALYKLNKLNCLIASIVTMLFLTVFELIMFILFKRVLLLDINDLANNNVYWILNNWLHIFLLLLTSFVITRIKSNKKHF